MTDESGKTRQVDSWETVAFTADTAGYVHILRDRDSFTTAPVPGWLTQRWLGTCVHHLDADGNIVRFSHQEPDFGEGARVIAAYVGEGGEVREVGELAGYLDTVRATEADEYIASVRRSAARRADGAL